MEGIIYKVLPYLESSKLLFTYTPEGKVTLIAKGALKMTSPIRVLSQYVTHIRFESSKSSMYTLKKPELLESFDAIKNDIKIFKEVAFLCELIDKAVLDDEHHEHIFLMLKQTLYHQNIQENILRSILHMLKYLGYDLSLVADGRPVKGFNIASSSIVYENEQVIANIEMTSLVWLLKLKHTTFETRIDLHESMYYHIKEHLKQYIMYHLHIKINN